MSDKKNPSRREFVKASAGALAGASVLGGLSLSRSAHAAGSDVIKVALIGCGGRGTSAVGQQMGADKGVRLIAVADTFEENVTARLKQLRRYEDQIDLPSDRIFIGLDAYKKALATDAELVVLATPPGFRPSQYKAAVEAGKHIFMEKPCCVDAPGYKVLQEANKLADEKELMVGVGLQRRHEGKYKETIQRIHDGAIGDVMSTRVYWNGQGIWNKTRKEGMTEMEYQVFNWYHFCWVCGDNICEQHIHNLDVGNWVQDAHPIEANGMGGCELRYEGGQAGTGQIFDHHFVEFTYENGAKMYSQCRHIRGCWQEIAEYAHGTKGSADCKKGEIFDANGEQVWKTTGGGGGHQQEQTDLLAALRAGERYNEGPYGATSSMTAVLGRMATYSGNVVKWADAVEKGESEFPEQLAWDAPAPVQKDEAGNYPIPKPGVYKAY
jgi:predicted dehydrogenase